MNSCLLVLLVIALVLAIILIIMSISTVEYYQYGLKQRKTGKVDTTQVFSQGRYGLGPAFGFLKYQADAHYESLPQLPVFSAGATNNSVGLGFRVDVDFTFFLDKDGIGELHRELASSYEHVIVENAKVAIKNEAIFVTFTQYFQNRTLVESRFREAVRQQWSSSKLPCTLDQFHVGRIQIPAEVAQRQLEARIQNELNDREKFLQQAQVERSKTAVQVNQILLEETKVKRTAEAEASLIRSKAQAQAQQMILEAQGNGTRFLVEAAGIVTQEQRTAFTYVRTLTNRKDLSIQLNYLTPENIVKTRIV